MAATAGTPARRAEPRLHAVRFFYVLFLPDGEAARCLDTIRLLANPEEKWRAHITVRGPYVRKLSEKALAHFNDLIRGNIVTVDGVGEFPNAAPDQHTIIFYCDGTKLRNPRVWHKPDYPGYTPHITLYDGSLPAIAGRLKHLAQRHPFRAQFLADELVPMQSIKGQQRMEMSWNYIEIAGPTEQRLTLDVARTLPIDERLHYIEKMFERLSGLQP
jgi:hypothetical protein